MSNNTLDGRLQSRVSDQTFAMLHHRTESTDLVVDTVKQPCATDSIAVYLLCLVSTRIMPRAQKGAVWLSSGIG